MDKARAKLLEVYEWNLSNAVDKEQYVGYARKFLTYTRGLDRHSIDEYLAMVHEDWKYKSSTVNFVFRVIHRLYVVNHLPWEYKPGEAPQIKQRDEYRPQLALEIIEMLINRAKEGKLLPYEQCFVALSSTYGLRRAEIGNMRPADVNISQGSIYVATLKSGRECYHLIPEEVKPYLANHDFDQRYAASTMNRTFKRVLVKSGARELADLRLGWHTIRRSLFEGLVANGLDLMAAVRFLRWKSGPSGLSIPARYYGNIKVGLKQHHPMVTEAENDEKAFDKHPFLPFWR